MPSAFTTSVLTNLMSCQAQEEKPELEEVIYNGEPLGNYNSSSFAYCNSLNRLGHYDVTKPRPQHTPEQRVISQSESPSIIDPRGSQCDVRRCIVKLIRQNASDTSVTEREFLRDVKPAHANIVQYFEITDDYIFMEQRLLGSLDRYLRPGINPPVIDWVHQLCEALVYIHSLGWAHNQLRPSNILVANHGSHLKICGFSRVTAIMGSADGTHDGRDDAVDIFSLGIMTWFIQCGGESVPEDLWNVDGTTERVRSLSTDGLQLTQIMDLCWSQVNVRPSAVTLRGMLRELLENSNVHPSQTDRGSQHKPPTDEKLAPWAGSFSASHSNVRLAVVKFPRYQLDDPDNPNQLSTLHLSFFAFHVEHTFLRTVKPAHPNIVRYMAITDNCIYTEHHIGSLECYLTPDIKPPVLEWTTQLCSALAYLHVLGFAHCDLRPHNILVGSGGSELLISDFGIVTRAHMPCLTRDDNTPPECAITVHQTAEELQEHPSDATDVYCLGLIVWFMQNGGKAIPTNYITAWKDDWGIYLDALPSHLDIVDLRGLQLEDFIRECWSPCASRPTATELLACLIPSHG